MSNGFEPSKKANVEKKFGRFGQLHKEFNDYIRELEKKIERLEEENEKLRESKEDK